MRVGGFVCMRGGVRLCGRGADNIVVWYVGERKGDGKRERAGGNRRPQQRRMTVTFPSRPQCLPLPVVIHPSTPESIIKQHRTTAPEKNKERFAQTKSLNLRPGVQR